MVFRQIVEEYGNYFHTVWDIGGANTPTKTLHPHDSATYRYGPVRLCIAVSKDGRKVDWLRMTLNEMPNDYNPLTTSKKRPMRPVSDFNIRKNIPTSVRHFVNFHEYPT